MRENSHSCFSPFSPAGFIRTGVAVLFSAVLAGCAGGGGFGGTADAGNPPNSIANPVEVVSRPISDQERRKVAEAVSRLNFRGAADVAPENVGVSRSEAILNVNPFAAAAESAEAPTRAAPREMKGYKAFEVALPSENPNMTVAVWISETPPEDAPAAKEEPGKKLLYLRLQVFISPNIPLLEGHNMVELESEVIVVEERRPTPPPVEEPETPLPTVLATVVDVPVTIAPPSPSTVAATLECAGGTLPAEGRTQEELDFEFLTATSRHFGWTSDICEWLRRGANVNAKSKPGWDKRGDWRVVKGRSGHTALHLPYLLPHYDSVGIMNLLVKHGAEINARNSAGETPLHMMIRRAPPAHPHNASHFLGFEPDIRAKTNNGQTPLHYAAQWGGLEIVKMLLARGAEPDLSAKDDDERTPLELAEKHHGELDDSPSAAPHVLHLREYLGKVIALLRDRTGVYPEDFLAGPLCPAGTLPANGMTQAELNLTLQAAAVAADTAEICEALRRGAEADARYSGNRTPLGLVAASRHSPDATVDAAKLLLANGADPDVYDDTYRWTALHWAIRRSSELMKALLAGGANADVLDKYDWTPLHWAVRFGGEGGAARARLLLDGGADVNMRGDDPGLSPLDYADERGQTAVAAALRDAGGQCFVRTGQLCGEAEAVAAAEVCAFDPSLPANGLTQEDWNITLWAAAWGRNPDAAGICEALRHGADVNMKGAHTLPDWYYHYHITPLHRVAWERHREPTSSAIAAAVDAVAVLLRNGADVHAVAEQDGATPLHRADLVEVADLLLKSGADVNARDRKGFTPLYGVIGVYNEERGERWIDMMSLLVRHGADIDARSDTSTNVLGSSTHGRATPLFQAIIGNSRSISAPGQIPVVVKNLLSHGADVNARNDEGHTPLHAVMIEAVFRNDDSYMSEWIEIMKALVASGADVNARFGTDSDSVGDTPLHYGFYRLFTQSPEMLTVLLDLGADVNAKDDFFGNTPLHQAIIELQNASESLPKHVMVDNIALLISRGADVNAVDRRGYTPLELAYATGNYLAVADLITGATGFLPGQGTVIITVAATVAATVVATVAEDVATVLPRSRPRLRWTTGRLVRRVRFRRTV